MNRTLIHGAFGAGLLAVGWIATGYLTTHPLALAMTAVIAAFYLMGAVELYRFRQLTAALDAALVAPAQAPERLEDWLAGVPQALRDAVRARIEGGRQALPGPAMTPYLAALLVLLGMLGTFLGMVVTLRGTGIALESARDLATMRDSLAAPVKGLGLAFGTSVAGVAASAMLGLMSALCRRDRLGSVRQLEALMAGPLRGFTRAYRDDLSLRLQQDQARLIESLAQQLQAAMGQVRDEARQSAQGLQDQAQQARQQMLAQQQSFHAEAQGAYRELAQSVEASLRRSLDDGARLAAATLQPAVQSALEGVAREAVALHERVAGTVQQQLQGLAGQVGAAAQASAASFEHGAQALSARATEALQAQLAALDQRLQATLQRQDETLQRQARVAEEAWTDARQRLQQQADGWLQALAQAQQARRQDEEAREAQRLAAWTQTLEATGAALQQQWQLAGAQTLAQQTQICRTLEDTAARVAAQSQAHAQATVAEVAALLQAAAEAPRAAAELVAQLREKLSDSLARDQATLEERARVMATLHTLLDAVQHTAAAQKDAIEQLVTSSSAWMAQAQAQFSQQMQGGSARLDEAAAGVAAGAAEVASLGEAFLQAVQLFGQNGERLAAQLQRVEEALGRSLERSDDQLAYYVAQARELIDLSLLSQRQIVEELQRVAPGAPAAGASAALVPEA